MTILTTTKQFNELYNAYKKYFVANQTPSFHNLLWQIIVNEVHGDKTVCFTNVLRAEGMEIGIVFQGESGYQPTSVSFLDEVEWEAAGEAMDEINEKLFGIKPDVCIRMISESMQVHDFTKAEAIQMMKDGKKMTHEYFDEKEWVTIDGDGMYLLEDGVRCTEEEFWKYRPEDKFGTGWAEFKEDK